MIRYDVAATEEHLFMFKHGGWGYYKGRRMLRRSAMANGGEVSSRGLIFQTIVAMLDCIKRNDWDEFKMEPPTDNNKVDFILYENGEILSAVQVKSSINQFEKWKSEDWIKALRKDVPNAPEIHLYLIGDKYSGSCRKLIEMKPEISMFPFDYLQQHCIGELVLYIKRLGLGQTVTVDDIVVLYRNLFAETIMNSITGRRISYDEFKEIFRSAIPRHTIAGLVSEENRYPQCLTSIPLLDQEVGLVGRENIVNTVRTMLDKNSCIVLVNGLGGIGKTAVMEEVCNELKNEGHHVAWIRCGDSLCEDLLQLRDTMDIPREEDADSAYRMIVAGIKRLGGKLYLFMDDLSRDISTAERDTLNGLGVHVMITSRKETLPFPKLRLDVLDRQPIIDMFYGYYRGDSERRYQDTVWSIIDFVHSHTLLVELLAKTAWEEDEGLDEFYEKLSKEGFFDVSTEEVWTDHDDDNLTIEYSVMKLYEIAKLSDKQRHIMKLFSIFTPEKVIYYKIREWASLDRKAMKKLVDLGWLDKVEGGFKIHQIVKDSLVRQMSKRGEEVRLSDYGDFLHRVMETKQYLSIDVTYSLVNERIVLAEDVAKFLDSNMSKYHIKQRDGMVGNLLIYHNQIENDNARGNSKPNSKDEIHVTGRLFNNLAGVYWLQGNLEKAQEYYEKSVSLFMDIQANEETDSIAIVYNNLAGVICNQGDYETALMIYGKAIAVLEKTKGVNHPYTATTYNNIAGVYFSMGDFEKAMEYYMRALVIRLNREEYTDTATTYNNMATIYKDQGDYDKAIECCEKALSISGNILGMDHADTATIYNCLGSIYGEQGDYENAKKYFKWTLSIYERIFGRNHPSTAMLYHSLAEIHYRLGEYKEFQVYSKKYNNFLTCAYMKYPLETLIVQDLNLNFNDSLNQQFHNHFNDSLNRQFHNLSVIESILESIPPCVTDAVSSIYNIRHAVSSIYNIRPRATARVSSMSEYNLAVSSFHMSSWLKENNDCHHNNFAESFTEKFEGSHQRLFRLYDSNKLESRNTKVLNVYDKDAFSDEGTKDGEDREAESRDQDNKR